MWLMVFFDLPTKTKKERKDYTRFRKSLLKDGFSHMQHSVYLRYCANRENTAMHTKRVQAFLPPNGDISILRITDKQFGMIESYVGKTGIPPPLTPQQLEMF